MYADERTELSSYLEEMPGLLEAFQQRVNDLPEYGTWLKHFGHDVRLELERRQTSVSPAHEQPQAVSSIE
jgi:hypothetical protein